MRWLALGFALWLIDAVIVTGAVAAADKPAEKRPPNVIVIFADDLGYGDLGCYGHPTIRTPNLDRMASEGLRLTQFYVAECVCTPSRAALLTGRLPIRNGMCSDTKRVLFTDSLGGLPAEEITIAETLKERGYATGCIGKWHLGHLPKFLPTRQGFDSYFGIPYSNDMRPTYLLRGAEKVEDPVDQTTLTALYTDDAVKFVRDNRERPFFLYLPHNFPHTPLFASENFKGASRRGLYGDVVEELDWSVGQVLDALREEKLAENTLVIFTSDNGPWLIRNQDGGSAGLLHGGKGSTWEGGMREPMIAWWPGTIPASRVSAELGCTTDLLATICSLTGAVLPKDRTLDSLDLSPLLLGTGESPRKSILYYRGRQLMAARLGPWKAHFKTQDGYGQAKFEVHDPPLLYNLEHDPSEKFDLSKKHPQAISDIRRLVAEHEAGLEVPPSQLEIR